LTYHLCAITSD